MANETTDFRDPALREAAKWIEAMIDEAHTRAHRLRTDQRHANVAERLESQATGMSLALNVLHRVDERMAAS